MNQETVIVYSLPECDRCQSLKNILNQKQIKFIEIDDRNQMKDMDIQEVPVISIDGEIIDDYNKIINWVKGKKAMNDVTVEKWLGENNKLGIDIWTKKYRRNNESFSEWLDRVSGGDKRVADLIFSKKFLFGGRILSNRGVDFEDEKTSLSNCYVIEPPKDTIESIYDTCKKLARTYSYGGGCGIDISGLSPAGAKVRNQAKETSGAVSFMDTFSQVTEQIGQNGRRGALMISMRCDHPDIEKFITIKSDLGKVNYANISVMITDDFMRAVEADTDWELSFTRPETNETIEKTVKAKDLFELLCRQNWDYAEPGMLFWDRIENYNLLSNNENFKYAGVNPCAEEPR
jgi:ribonucleoside-diphosphate reductase alpha chain